MVIDGSVAASCTRGPHADANTSESRDGRRRTAR